VMSMEEAARIGDVSAPSPAQERARSATLRLMKDGAIISNSGHFNVEIDIRRSKNCRLRNAPRVTSSTNTR